MKLSLNMLAYITYAAVLFVGAMVMVNEWDHKNGRIVVLENDLAFCKAISPVKP